MLSTNYVDTTQKLYILLSYDKSFHTLCVNYLGTNVFGKCVYEKKV